MDFEETPFLVPEDSEEGGDIVLSRDDEIFVSSHPKRSTRVNKRCLIICGGIVALLVLLVAVFGFGVLVGNQTAPIPGCHPDTTSNGTSSTSHNISLKEEICGNPPVLLISLDGFWNGYFARNVTPNLSTLAKEGVKAKYVRSAYPTKTFPNHFTIVTGLYPESHGIVDNYFYDKVLVDSFYLGNNDPKWWLGEPVWVTAQKQKLKSGTYFWPGSEVPIQGMLPTYYKPYVGSVPFEERVMEVLEWLEYPSELRPQFMTLYLNEPDHSGHAGGPDSVEVAAALGRVDEVIEDIIVRLKAKDIYVCVNIVVVSDHGMGSSDPDKKFFIPPHIPEGHDVSYPNYGVNMNINVGDDNDSAVEEVYAAIQNISGAPFQVYYLDDVPLRLHAGRHNRQRYGDLYLAGDLGSYVTYKSNSRVYKGVHGYDNNEFSMQSIFLAHGPAFKEGYVAPPFDNIQIYNLLCALLKITPSENNGTFGALHHMLKPDVADGLPPVEETEGVEGVKVDCILPDYDCKTCFCSHSCQNEQNEELVSSSDPKAAEYQSMHLPLGVPRGGEGDGACLLTNKHSVSLFSTVLHIPLWVAFTLTSQMDLQSVDGSTLCYQADPRTSSLQCSDYNTSSDYTLTALAPSIDEMQLKLISNAVPQHEHFYQMVWSKLEQQLLCWTSAYGTLHVITGSLLDSNADGARDRDADYDHWLNGEGSVAIPSGFYSIVSRCVEARSGSCPVSSVEVLGLLLHHRNIASMNSDITKYLKYRQATVSDIESATGINFFPALSPEQQAALKIHITTDMWN